MRVLGALIAMVMMGCGDGAAPSPAPVASTGGEVAEAPADDEGAEVEQAQEQAPPSEPAPSGPATIAFNLTVAGEEITGKIKVREAGGTVVAEGTSGQAIQLDSGTYRAEVLADTSAIVDGPTQWVELDLQPGENPAAVVDFPWAKVRLDVKVNGKPVKGTVELLRRGDSVAILPIAGDGHVLISPGRYQGKIKTGNSEIEVTQIVIPEGATRNVPINVTW